jgi:hypothetical protein
MESTVPIPQLEAKLLSIPSGPGRLAQIIAWAKQLSDEAIDSMGGQPAVDAKVHELYDHYVVPLDIPGVPAIAEPAVDTLIKRIISALIWSVDDET